MNQACRRITRCAGLSGRRLWLHDLRGWVRFAAAALSASRLKKTISRLCSVLSGNRNFEGRIHPRGERARTWCRRRWWWLTRSRAPSSSTSQKTRWARAAMVSRCISRTFGPSDGEIDAGGRAPSAARTILCNVMAACEEGVKPHWKRGEGARRRDLSDGTPASSMLKEPPFFTGAWLAKNPRGDFQGARVLALAG